MNDEFNPKNIEISIDLKLLVEFVNLFQKYYESRKMCNARLDLGSVARFVRLCLTA